MIGDLRIDARKFGRHFKFDNCKVNAYNFIFGFCVVRGFEGQRLQFNFGMLSCSSILGSASANEFCDWGFDGHVSIWAIGILRLGF